MKTDEAMTEMIELTVAAMKRQNEEFKKVADETLESIRALIESVRDKKKDTKK